MEALSLYSSLLLILIILYNYLMLQWMETLVCGAIGVIALVITLVYVAETALKQEQETVQTLFL